MFYRTYRPKTLADLDNSRVRDVIGNILQSAHLPHAFLLVGPKGTGKTSSARIIAKSINCLNNKYAGKNDSVEPCNECSNCLSIEQGSSPDVVEQDAASNRGIEEIRNLIKEAAFSPIATRYRTFIIDEAHMITHDAFNALLKTLEEPPQSVVFILATTNEEKVPQTIISRCQKISFGRAKKADIISRLKKISQKEHLKIGDQSLNLIATYSDYSFRDAAKILEELATQNKLEPQEIQQYIGIRSKHSLLTILQEKPVKEALQWVEEFVSNGGNIKYLLEDLLDELRIALLLKHGITVTEEDTVSDQLTLSIIEITRLLKLFQEAYTLLRLSPIESIPLEIALIEFYNGRK